MGNRYVETSDSDEWKSKYLESLESQEAFEKLQGARLDLLRRGLVGVSLAADGVDENLDGLLTELRDLLRSSKAIDEMEPVLGEIETAVRKLDESKEKNHTQLSSGFESIVNQLCELQPPRKIKSKIKHFSQTLSDEVKDERNHGHLMNLISVIQAETLQTLRDRLEQEKLKNESEGSENSFLKKWLGRKKNEDNLDETQTRDGSINESLEQPEAELVHGSPDVDMSPELIDTIPEVTSPLSRHVKNFADNLSDTYEGEAVRERVGGIILTLLDQLIIPSSLKFREESIREKISEGLRWPEIPVTLSEVVSLVSRSQLEAQKETEFFLHDLNGKLAEIEKFLIFNEQSNQDRNENRLLLTDTVSNHIKEIQDNINDLENGTDLRLVIGQQIEFITQAMETFKHEEQAIENSSEDKISVLVERLDVLEKQSAELKLTIAEQSDRAYLDPLTQIPNRLAYERRSKEEYSRWQRYNSPLSLAVADIDLFKRINDTYGHVAGDKVLKVIAKLLSEDLREADFICRYGGEEFVIIFPETESTIAVSVLEKIRNRVASCPFHFKKNPVQITVSFGVSQFIEGDTVVSVFKRADKGLYRAKELGRDQVALED